jgi:hypothetical protein
LTRPRYCLERMTPCDGNMTHRFDGMAHSYIRVTHMKTVVGLVGATGIDSCWPNRHPHNRQLDKCADRQGYAHTHAHSDKQAHAGTCPHTSTLRQTAGRHTESHACALSSGSVSGETPLIVATSRTVMVAVAVAAPIVSVVVAADVAPASTSHCARGRTC